MRNVTVFAILVIMLNGVPSAAQEKSRAYTLSSWTSFGIFYGQSEEIVYPPSNHPAEKLSQLLWDIKPVFYYGLSLDFSRTQPMDKWGFFSTVSLKNGIPGKSGIMEDRDWLSTQNAALTNYSVHDNHTNRLFFFDVSAGLSFPLGKSSLLLKPYVTMSYMHFSFTGQYGHGTYALGANGIYRPIDEDSAEHLSFADWEKVINYTQDWLTVAPGISLGYALSRFYAEIFFNISPLVTCKGMDEHLVSDNNNNRMNTAVYKDNLRGGVFLEPGFHFSFIANKRLEFALDFSWRYMRGAKGGTWSGSPIGTADFDEVGEAGAGLSLLNMGLCMKIRL